MDCGSLSTRMEHNPYAPPTASVSDPVPTPMPERPLAVKRGIALLSTSLVLGIVNYVWGFEGDSPEMSEGLLWAILLAMGVLIFGLIAFLIYKIWQRRHWARVVYLILALLGYPLMFFIGTWEELQADIVGTALEILGAVADIIGIVLIFTKPANRWFRAR